MRTVRLFAILFLAAAAYSLTYAGEAAMSPISELPAISELPNPFVFADGSPLQTKDDWQRRRAELKQLFQNTIYGHLPPKPEKMTVERGDRLTDEVHQVSTQSFKIKLEQSGQSLELTTQLALPARPSGKLPVIVQGAPGQRPQQDNAPSPFERLAVLTSRGYAVAEINLRQLAIDDKAQAKESGVYQLFGKDSDCGALMAWAWGMHRVIDALETMPEVDTSKIVVTGHSRYGKAALFAGAFDDRIALTVPSHSGCAGCAPFRFIYGNAEQLQNIVGFAPHWFRPDFNQFVGHVNQLPVDQHELISLVAPRTFLDTEGTEDAWTNPEGAEQTHLAAEKVYEFLGAGNAISIRYRPVAHIPSTDDLLDYADHVFFDKPLPADFGKLPYERDPKAITWDAPK